MKFLEFISRNKLLSIIISIGISIFIVGILGNILIKNKVDDWSSVRENKINDIEIDSKKILKDRQENLLLKTKNILSKLSHLQSTNYKDFQKLLKDIDYNKFEIGIYENDNLIYWNEKFLEKSILNGSSHFNLGEIFFLKFDINTYLVVQDTFSINQSVLELHVFEIIEKHYRLNEDYFTEVSLVKEISDKVGVDISLEYSTKEADSKDGRKQSFIIENNKEAKIGTATFIIPTRVKAVEDVEDSITIVQGILTLIGFILIGFILKDELNKTRSRTLKILFISGYVIVLRYLLVLINFPKSIISSELLIDKYYYSSFGSGLANSPIDLFITLVIAFYIAFLSFHFSQDYYRNHPDLNRNIFSVLLISIIGIAFYLLSLRGIGAAIRGTVFDTSLKYFQSSSLGFTIPHLLMHINILLLGLISVLGSSAILLLILKIVNANDKVIRVDRILYIIVFIIFGIILLTIIQNTPQLTIAIKILHLLFIISSIYIIIKFDLQTITKVILFFGIASLFSIGSLLYYNTQLERASLKRTASIIARYDDDWHKNLISETLLSNFSRKSAISAFENRKTNFNSAAFKIWSKSQLQKEAINSSINFINLQGELLGGFGSIYPSVSIDRFIDTNAVIEEIQIFEEPTENENQKLIRGIFPVKDEFAFLGYIDVSILSDLNDFGFSSHPQFISAGKLNEKAILKLDKLIILDYRDSVLKTVYGNFNPNQNINQAILNAQFTKNNDSWLELQIYDSHYLVYVKNVRSKVSERILAIALREKELSIGLFDFFKIFFTHSLILLAIVIVYFLYYESKVKYKIDLRKKLLFAFLIISVIPLILTALYFRNLTEEKNNDAIYYKLGKRAFSVEKYLNENFFQNEDGINYEKTSNDLNIYFTIYRGNRVEYSTHDLIYDVGLLSKIINPSVYHELKINEAQETLVQESVDGFEFNSFYYKANILGEEIIVKVADGFNNIRLPLSGSEVDIFLFGFYSLAVFLIIIFSAIFANQISSPIRKITSATKSVAAGDLSLELKTNAKGELGELVSGFQYMIKEIKKNQSILAEIEREEAWKEMAKQVAHEIKNPLTPMKLSVQQLITAYDDKSEKFESFFRKVTGTILNQIETLKNIATEFSNFARMPKLKLENIDVIEIINQSIDLFTDENISIKSSYITDGIFIKGDAEQLKRTIINLIRNSIQANATKIELVLSTLNNSYELSVIDNGRGINESDLYKVFDTNFTTKEDGMGIGLSLAKRYLRSVHGDIKVEKSTPEGTTIKLTFPK